MTQLDTRGRVTVSGANGQGTKHTGVKKVILFNGPPSSGKDQAALSMERLLENKAPIDGGIPYRPRRMKMAEPLKQAVHALYGLPFSCEHYEREYGSSWKDTPQPEFFGHTPRSVYISMSEEYAKVQQGESFFGRVLARKMQLDKQSNVFLISDAGFLNEVVPLALAYGKEKLLVVELEREGKTFEGDSRDYIGAQLQTHPVTRGTKVIRIPNNDSIMMLRHLLQGIAAMHLNFDPEFTS